MSALLKRRQNECDFLNEYPWCLSIISTVSAHACMFDAICKNNVHAHSNITRLTAKPGQTGTHGNHGMKTSNWHPTPMYNPWNEGFKLSDSHIQPMEQRPQTSVQLPCTTHGTSNLTK